MPSSGEKMTLSIEKTLRYLGEDLCALAPIARLAAPGGVRFRAPQLPARAVMRLAKHLAVAEGEILAVTDISERTYHRRQSRKKPLTTNESDRLLRVARVAAEAERVFGHPAKARRWLTTGNPLLGATPLSLLGFDSGAREVERELVRIDFCDFA